MATALLGVLLWVVLSIVRDLARAPEVPLPLPAEDSVTEFDPDLPRIVSGNDLRTWLRELGMDGDALVDDLRSWRAQRGYKQYESWHDLPVQTQQDDPDRSALETLDDPALIMLAGDGSVPAAQLLAQHSLESNPVEALDWLDQAIVNGSIHDMLRSADLLITFSDPALTQFDSDPVYATALAEINARNPAPPVSALAWSIAAVSVGGYAVVDDRYARRIETLTANLNSADTAAACATAQDYVLSTAMARRAKGGAVFSTERPLFAVSVANPQDMLPCDTPVIPLVNMSDCLTRNFVGPGNRLWSAWFCPSP